MQKLLKQLNKQFDRQLIKQKDYQGELEKMHRFLKEQNVDWKTTMSFLAS